MGISLFEAMVMGPLLSAYWARKSTRDDKEFPLIGPVLKAFSRFQDYLEAKYEIERLRNDLRLVIMTDNEYCKGLGEDTKRLWEALKGLLQCPAIADGNHNEPAWYDPETAMAEKKARACMHSEG